MKKELYLELIAEEFAFLVTDFGFRSSCSDAVTTGLRFEKEPISVEVVFEDGPEVLISHTGFGEFSLHTYFRLRHPSVSKAIGHSIASNDKQIEELLALYARGLEKHGSNLLNGDTEAFSELMQAEGFGIGLDLNEQYDAYNDPNSLARLE